ncbi:MAG TPA: hypothetical protein VGU44_01190 [Gammaproteobacteria bacterium]|nr:hypothetical protein [Gammaproteobacteria bacterium]
MSKHILILAVIFLGTFSTDISLARQPTKQPPIAVFNNGEVQLSADFIEYLIEVKEFQSQHEVFRTVQYNFPEIQLYARDFLKEGTQKTEKVKQKKMEARRAKWALESAEEEKKMNEHMLGITGHEFLVLFDEVLPAYSSKKGDQQQEYLEFLEKRILEKNVIHKTKNNKSMFCCEPSYFQTSRERAISTVKKKLKKYGFLDKEDFLNGSAAPVIQEILIKDFPCKQVSRS